MAVRTDSDLDPTQALALVLDGQDLTRVQARALFEQLMAGEMAPAYTGALLAALRAKGESVGEVAGAALAMRDAAIAVEAPPRTVDLCGTGGDGSGTVNVSTAAALVVAAAGVPVAKHGNRAISSKAGSADLLASLGVPLDLDPQAAAVMLAERKFVFLFAPHYHPAMRHAVPVRRALGVRTIFNLLGPLTNPARVRRQLLGVYDRRWVLPLAEVLGELGHERALVVYGEDGLDEISLSAETYGAEWLDGTVRPIRLTPEEFGFRRVDRRDLAGGDVDVNREKILAALCQRQGPIADWITLNAGAALRVAQDLPWTDAIEWARETIRSGKPLALIDSFDAEASS